MKLEKRQRFIINTGYYVIIVAILYLLFKYMLNILLPFLLALLFSAIMQPPVRYITKKWRMRPKLAALLVLIVFLALLFGIVVLVIARSVSGVVGLVDSLPGFYKSTVEPALHNLLDWLEDVANRINPSVVEIIEDASLDIVSAVGNAVTSFSVAAVSSLTGMVGKLPSFLLSAVIFVIAVIFVSVDYNRITRFIISLLPENIKSGVIDVKNSLVNIAFSYGKSYLLIMLITFSELSAGLLILRAPNAFTVAAVTAIIDIFPVVGSGLVLLPWALFSIFQGNIVRGIGLLILYAIISVVRQIIEPRIVGRHVGLHPLATLLCMFVGLRLFGGVGMLALPITAAILKNLVDTGVIPRPGRDAPNGETPPDTPADTPKNKSVYD